MKPSLWAALLAATAPSWAQQQLQTVVVTGNPLGSGEVATPSSVLSGSGLVLRRGSSLGETLDGLPGVSATYFGPNANRPVIRGQDGDRIRVLSNAGASLDASSLSFDHAVPIDPLVVERIEVLRGPAALLYGGSAVGGVVNAIDNRIPKARIDGVSGAVEARFGGAASERAVSALVETGGGGGTGFALHADAFGRKTSDLRVPAFDRPLEDGSTERRTRIVNSASQAQGGAAGGSLVWDRGYLGASADTYRNDYGIVAEDDITIQMRRHKVALAGEVRVPDGFITTLRGQAAGTDYQHQEIEGDGSVGTTAAAGRVCAASSAATNLATVWHALMTCSPLKRQLGGAIDKDASSDKPLTPSWHGSLQNRTLLRKTSAIRPPGPAPAAGPRIAQWRSCSRCRPACCRRSAASRTAEHLLWPRSAHNSLTS